MRNLAATNACAIRSIAAATHSIVANYDSDANNAVSVAPRSAQVVNASGAGGGSSTDDALAANCGVASG